MNRKPDAYYFGGHVPCSKLEREGTTTLVSSSTLLFCWFCRVILDIHLSFDHSRTIQTMPQTFVPALGIYCDLPVYVNLNTLFPGGIVYEDKENEERVVISEPRDISRAPPRL